MNDARSGRHRWQLVWHKALRPPVADPRFWVIQAIVLGLAGLHLALDVAPAEPTAVPVGVPVALLLAPISYAALRYGLAGSAATALWATLLWLPDLLLPRDRGHPGNDLIELALVLAVAVFVGYHIDVEQLERGRAQQARSAQQAAEARYRQLFDTNAAPILVADDQGMILDANPAARALLPGRLIGVSVPDILPVDAACHGRATGQIIGVPATDIGVRQYRVDVAQTEDRPGNSQRLTQLVLQDVTAERAEGDRAHRFAELLLKVQEAERRRIAQELHDEPLQLLVQLARTLEAIAATSANAADGLAPSLEDARNQTIDVASRLRTVVAGLRPPALEQLGLVPALRGLVADLAEVAPVPSDVQVTGEPARLPAEVELAAFRIAQEAVNNAIQHAGAGHLLLTLIFDAAGLRLRIADDGRGFDATAVDRQLAAGRLGLLGMRERAALAGGQLTVTSDPGRGTVVEVAFPGGREPHQARQDPRSAY
jgi:signal transduction histidine kinase